MQTPVSLKTAERQAFQITFTDGLWDVFLGLFPLQFAVAPLLSESMGDFWSSAIFLPVFGAVYLVIRLMRKYVIAPRMGTVNFGKARKEKLRKFSRIMLGINALVFIMGILAAAFTTKIFDSQSIALFGSVVSMALGLILLAGFSLAAVLLDWPRLYFYGLLLFAAPPVGEWLYQNHGAAHHGYPIVFGITAGVMILTGLITFVRMLKNNPRIELPGVEA
jgi:MFS family permease